MERKFYCIFVAGGIGARMGADVPKQFLKIDGTTILQRTIERFVEAAPDLNVITVLPEAHFETWKDICATGSLDIPQILVQGGITRFHSVKNALEKVPDGVIVSIHDGVRPVVSAGLIRRMREKMSECPALIPVIPIVDTLRSTDPSVPAPDRSRTVAVQTPQMFHSEVIKEAYKLPFSTLFTDDASVAEANETPLAFVEGERCNIKITTPEDLRLAKLYLSL